jgi:hypothetical protein
MKFSSFSRIFLIPLSKKLKLTELLLTLAVSQKYKKEIYCKIFHLISHFFTMRFSMRPKIIFIKEINCLKILAGDSQ